ncbi:hypothetical protein T484DRAFT_1772228 [Baffinella frigidus]|nr:hypothetical protein T484DRAFT_1772228 [Cryptophyta sp. CCMP2293]
MRDAVRACSTLRGHTDALRAVAWSPDNSTLITTSTDRTLKVWQVSRGDAAELPLSASLIATSVE